MVEDFLDPKEEDGSKFSMQGKIRNVSVQSARKKIDHLRKY